jgi:formylglycine-generating enzyme required for sulfatase activity
MQYRFSAFSMLAICFFFACTSETNTPITNAVDSGSSRQIDTSNVQFVNATSPTSMPSANETATAVDAGLSKEGTSRPVSKSTGFKELQVARPAFSRSSAGQTITIPKGTLLAGSQPEDPLRVNYAENDMVPHQMTSFEIDALPFPNDPDRPFLTGVTRDEAEQICTEVGKRLCTELEWEWACKSADNRRFPTGNSYLEADYPEGDRLQPASPFGVLGMGQILEWTRSVWGREPDQVERGVARGFALEQEQTSERGRRCAHRWRRYPEGTNPSLGFRCCRGEVNKAACFVEPTRPAFSLYNTMKPEKFTEVIRSIPEIDVIHNNPHMFSDTDVRAVLARRNSDREALSKQGIHFRWKPMRWIPRQGMELWVAVGRSDRHSFIVALHETKDNEVYAHASSMILWNQPIPLSLAYREGHRDELYWAACWGCRDGGAVTFDDKKNEVIITHKW